ncbi:MAG: hypothetical protein MJZ83_11900 [Bacteroidaceae bacterium]|nr:hypothetical protein [Bacteroidaceae bacterium]
MDLWQNILNNLNENAGLVALIGVILSFVSIILTMHYNHKQDKYRIEDFKDEYDAMTDNSGISMLFEDKDKYQRKMFLQKKLRRK